MTDNNEQGQPPSKDLLDHNLSKLQLDDHIKAYWDKKPLERESHITPCKSENVEKVVNNYVIAKQILSNLSWQEKLLYQHVCSTWHSAIKALKKEQLSPFDFMVKFYLRGKNQFKFRDPSNFKIIQSSTFYSEPLVVFIFMNIPASSFYAKCQNILPCPCGVPCDKDHLAIDVIQKISCAPKDCMLAAKAHCLTYMPLPASNTEDGTIKRINNRAFIGGLYIPLIPNVKFHKINLKTNTTMQEEFYSAIDKIAVDDVIKGVIVFVTDKHLLQSVEDIVFLNHIKDVQPDIPYALGGCICEDTICDTEDINHLVNSPPSTTAVSDNLISIGIFTIPKNTPNESNFDMFSLILESSEWDKPKIQAAITQFSKDVPQYEHSVCLRLSCVGRDRRHSFEQDSFRAVFPNTRMAGCYGNGELGINHPEKPIPELTKYVAKRTRRDSGPQFGIIYSYSTVFVYMGWGKIIQNKGNK